MRSAAGAARGSEREGPARGRTGRPRGKGSLRAPDWGVWGPLPAGEEKADSEGRRGATEKGPSSQGIPEAVGGSPGGYRAGAPCGHGRNDGPRDARVTKEPERATGQQRQRRRRAGRAPPGDLPRDASPGTTCLPSSRQGAGRGDGRQAGGPRTPGRDAEGGRGDREADPGEADSGEPPGKMTRVVFGDVTERCSADMWDHLGKMKIDS